MMRASFYNLTTFIARYGNGNCEIIHYLNAFRTIIYYRFLKIESLASTMFQ